jgi:hypothetical protein
MDIKTAQEAFGLDRLLMIGLIQYLLDKKVIESTHDLSLLHDYCKQTLTQLRQRKLGLTAFGPTSDAVVNIQLDQTRKELDLFFRSFKLP